MAYVKLFDSVAAEYALYRPTYPKSILNIILEFMSKNNGSGHNVAVDVGSGSGQSTFVLCDHFEKVIGVDSSAAQITNAQKKIPQMLPESKYKIIEFKVGNAHDLPLESSSADVITCASAWHWLEPDLFYKEAKRVLKPNGTLAVYGYRNADLSVGDYHCQKMMADFVDRLKEAGCWHERNIYCENKYSAVNLPFAVTERHEILMPWNTSVENFIGFLSSMSGYKDLKKMFPDDTLLLDVKKNYLEGKGEQQSNPQITVMFFVFIIVGKKGEN